MSSQIESKTEKKCQLFYYKTTLKEVTNSVNFFKWISVLKDKELNKIFGPSLGLHFQLKRQEQSNKDVQFFSCFDQPNKLRLFQYWKQYLLSLEKNQNNKQMKKIKMDSFWSYYRAHIFFQTVQCQLNQENINKFLNDDDVGSKKEKIKIYLSLCKLNPIEFYCTFTPKQQKHLIQWANKINLKIEKLLNHSQEMVVKICKTAEIYQEE